MAIHNSPQNSQSSASTKDRSDTKEMGQPDRSFEVEAKFYFPRKLYVNPAAVAEDFRPNFDKLRESCSSLDTKRSRRS